MLNSPGIQNAISGNLLKEPIILAAHVTECLNYLGQNNADFLCLSFCSNIDNIGSSTFGSGYELNYLETLKEIIHFSNGTSQKSCDKN